MNEKMTPHEAALAACAAGISVLPPKQDGTKRPDSTGWTKHQRERATKEQINIIYAQGRTGVGWVTGEVSGNLEVMDFDDRSALAEYCKFCKEAGLDGLLDRVMRGYFEHTPNGAHLAYRCSTIEGNKKLAKGKNKKALIETRGEGGFIIVAPSHGGVNAAGEYVLESGGVAAIVTITPKEREALHDIARMLDESIQPTETRTMATGYGDRPGDDYSARVSWSEVLEPHGWVRVSSRLGVVSWRRPGKELGISATTNHANSDLLYVFSTSTEFEAERGYNKFSAYSLLAHGGDFKAASRELRLLGYGQQIEAPSHEVDLSLIMARFDKKPVEPQPDFDELLRVPGLVGELATWINESSIKPQPVLALGAAISAMATILGRKVQTETGLRTNVYVLGVGETGCGKERARQAIRQLFDEIGVVRCIGESFASDSAVESAVIADPACLYLIDELGHFLGTVRDEHTPSYVRSILPILLRMYSASESMYRRRTYADSKKNDDNNESVTVDQPCLSIYGTTVPQNLYSSISKEHASDGFLSRLLVFESGDPDPYVRIPDQETRKTPQELVDGFGWWGKAKINPTAEGNLEAERPNPLIVKATKDAWSVFDGLENRMREKRRIVREAGGDQGPYTRIWATAQKLALIRACGIRLEMPEITETDARWGAGLAWALTDRFLDRVGKSVVENKTESDTNRVLELIIKSKEIKHRDLTRKTQWLTRSNRMDIIASLIEAGQIKTDKNQKTTIYKYETGND
jgi:hypothetical protein